MADIKNVFDEIDEFEIIENIVSNIYVNNELKIENILLDKVKSQRNSTDKIIIEISLKSGIWDKLTKGIDEIYNLNIRIKIVEPIYAKYKEIILTKAVVVNETVNTISNDVKFIIETNEIEYISKIKDNILKEWYGSNNEIDCHHGSKSSKKYDRVVKYKYDNKIVFQSNRSTEKYSSNSFWIKMPDYKFRISIDDAKTQDEKYHNYCVEYREEWGKIPDEEIRNDISRFLSFIIGTEMVKFGESGYSKCDIVRKKYKSPSVLQRSSLFENNFEFYCNDFLRNDTDNLLKQLPKMLKKYFTYKDEFRLNEVFAALYVHSYLNFNFINYVTYIEMFSNIFQEGQKIKTVIDKNKFKTILKILNSINKIPKPIKNKFNGLNTIGIGKKVKKLLTKYKIDYNRYEDVFKTRGKVVHGGYVEIEDMYIASQKAKELLTIITLKKLGYKGYIRNFINNEEMISIKDGKTEVKRKNLK